MPLKIINGFKQVSRNPLLLELLEKTRKDSKGLQCHNHPGAESSLKLSLKDGSLHKVWNVCCEDFKERAVYELSYQGNLDRENHL